MNRVYCELKEKLTKNSFTTSNPFKIYPHRSFCVSSCIEGINAHIIKIDAEELYLKNNIPFVADCHHNELACELLVEQDLQCLISLLP